jgi:chromosome segregation ATPase
MNHSIPLEAHIQKNEQAIQELAIQIEVLNRDVHELLKELKVSPEQLTAFVENKDNFSEENWNTLLEQRKALDEKLLRELQNVSNPQKTKKTLKTMNVQPHWLFVR